MQRNEGSLDSTILVEAAGAARDLLAGFEQVKQVTPDGCGTSMMSATSKCQSMHRMLFDCGVRRNLLLVRSPKGRIAIQSSEPVREGVRHEDMVISRLGPGNPGVQPH